MNIPNKLKVGGRVYTVNVTPRLFLGCQCSAEILYSDLQINITPQAPEKMEGDLLHEMVHAIFAHLGYQEHDEQEVEAIAQALQMVINDNPKVFAPRESKASREKASRK